MLKNIAWVVIVLAQVLAPLVAIYWRFLLNRKVSVGEVVTSKIRTIGGIKPEDEGFRVRFLWSSRKLRIVNAITMIGYTDDDFSMTLPSTESIEIKFKGGISVVFNSKGSKTAEQHRKIVDDFAQALGIALKEHWWSEASHGTEDDPVVFYKKEEKK